MCVDVVDLVRRHARVVERDRRGPRGLRPVGPRLDHVMGVGRRPIPAQLRVRHGAAPFRHVGRLQDQECRALAHDEPVTTDIERPGGATRVPVVAGGERTDEVERTERERAERHFAATRDGGIDSALAQVPERLAQCDRPRGARVGRRQDRPPHIERDAQIRRGRAAEDGEGEVGRDPAEAPLEVALVLFLRIRDAAERGPEVDPDALRVGPAARPRRQPCVIEGEPPRDQAELTEPVELARRLGGHPGDRVEVVHLGRDLRAERGRIEPVDALDRGAPAPQPRPEGVEPGPGGGDQPESRDPDAAALVHAGGSVRATVPATVPATASVIASASALNVASVRPAIGRVKARSTNEANRPSRGRKSWSMATRQPPTIGSIRQVTSIPFVAPATCTNRSCSVVGSFHVRARHATGSPRLRAPSTSMRGRRATNPTTSAPSVRRSIVRDLA